MEEWNNGNKNRNREKMEEGVTNDGFLSIFQYSNIPALQHSNDIPLSYGEGDLVRCLLNESSPVWM